MGVCVCFCVIEGSAECSKNWFCGCKGWFYVNVTHMVSVAETVSAGFGVTKENLTKFAAGHSQTYGDISLGRQGGCAGRL